MGSTATNTSSVSVLKTVADDTTLVGRTAEVHENGQTSQGVIRAITFTGGEFEIHVVDQEFAVGDNGQLAWTDKKFSTTYMCVDGYALVSWGRNGPGSVNLFAPGAWSILIMPAA